MSELEIVQVLLSNPQFVAAIIALIWNLCGYVAAMFHVKGLEKYEVTKLLETFVMIEAVFTIMSTVVGLPLEWSTIIAIAIVVIRGIKSAIDNNTTAKIASS